MYLDGKANGIGVSVLDSRSLRGVDPGDDGKPWFDLMQHLHMRPIEHKKYVNKRFVKGCADQFNFGESVEVKIQDAGRILDRIFSDPSRIHEASNLDTAIPDIEPSIMLVGHDLKNDTDYLKRLNFTTKHVAGKIDTQRMARISKKQSPGLSKLLAALSIDAKNLHNAGNDAAYTLQALVSVAVQEHRQPGNTVKILTANKEALDAARAITKAEAAEKAGAAKKARKAPNAARAANNADSAQRSTADRRTKEVTSAAKATKNAQAAQKTTGTTRTMGTEKEGSNSGSPEHKDASKSHRLDNEARDSGAKIPRSVGKASVKGKPIRRELSSKSGSDTKTEETSEKTRRHHSDSTLVSRAKIENAASKIRHCYSDSKLGSGEKIEKAPFMIRHTYDDSTLHSSAKIENPPKKIRRYYSDRRTRGSCAGMKNTFVNRRHNNNHTRKSGAKIENPPDKIRRYYHDSNRDSKA